MSSREANDDKEKIFELGVPSSEDSFTPSETSEKYEDVFKSSAPPVGGNSRKRERTRRPRSGSKKVGSDKSSVESKDSTRLMDTSPPDNGGVNEGVQTDYEYLERLSPRSDKIDEEDEASEQVLIPKRHLLLLMIFLGFVNIYAMRVNLNVAIVAMVNNKTVITPTGEVEKIVSTFESKLLLLKAASGMKPIEAYIIYETYNDVNKTLSFVTGCYISIGFHAIY